MNTPKAILKLIIADDHELIRKAVADLLETTGIFQVVAQAGDGDQLHSCIDKYKADVLIVDLRMPEFEPIQDIEKISLSQKNLKIIVLTGQYEKYLFSRIEKLVCGVILKTRSAEEIVSLILELISENKSVSDEKLFQAGNNSVALSPSEKNILRLVANGMKAKEIAEFLGVKVNTVEVHKINVRRKLKLKNNMEMIRYALYNGLD